MSALPEWPAPLDTETMEDGDELLFLVERGRTALARLQVISNREYMQHLDWCPAADPAIGPILNCECGLDELLADLLPKGETS